MSKMIMVRQPGGPESMKLEETELRDPEAGEVLIEQSVIGVNFIDCYHRSGLYPLPLPLTPGMEGIGRIRKLGAGISEFKENDRVCYSAGPTGGYGESRLIPADKLVKIPDALTDEQLSGCLLRGMTVWYLISQLRELKAGEQVLFHAAAGGVGQIFCQWAKSLGVEVIGTVGSRTKVDSAKESGCDHVIVSSEQNFVDEVKRLTSGQGVSVVYDGVGKDTFQGSLDCLTRRGLMVSFGNASGPPPLLEVGSLAPKGSLFVTRPTLIDYTSSREELLTGMTALFDVLTSGRVKNRLGQSYPLQDAAKAHEDLENRRTEGSTILFV